MIVDRRALLASACLLALAPSAAAAQIGDYAIDWRGAPVDAAIAARLERQIDMVRALPIRPAILAFFARQPIFVAPPGVGSHADAEGIFITRDPFPDDNPVLLHELCHRYQGRFLSDPPDRDRIDGFMAAARRTNRWPAQAYMFTNRGEFFAMTASVVLHGRAARPPYTREQVRDAVPALYAFIVNQFGLRT